jgi:chromosome segregation ATPase
LATDHDTLQRRYVEASAQANRLRKELSAIQSSHDERRHQLDLRVNEIEDLRREVSEQARELERIESEKNQARADRSGIVRSVASLEADLRRVISDAEVLGRDLKDLKIERDRSETRHRDELGKADRAQKQLSAQLRLANEQLEAQREKTKKAITEWDNHVCQS